MAIVAVCALAGGLGITAAPGATAASARPALAVPADQITALTSLSGSATSVTFDPTTLGALTKAGVTLKPTGGATLAGSVIRFPITSGYVEIHSVHTVNPGWIQGSFQHDGSGFSLSRGGVTVSLSNFSVDPGDSLLYGTVDGTKAAVPLLFLDGSHVAVSTGKNTVDLNGTVAELTPTAATALNSALKLTAFTAGLPLGAVSVVADATAEHPYPASDIMMAVPHLPGGASTFAVTPAARSVFAAAGVTLAPSGSATQTPVTASGSTLSFPITGGTVVLHKNHAYKPGYVDGSITHEASGLTFGKGSTLLAAGNFVADPGDSILTASVGSNNSFPLLFLDGTNFAQQLAKLTPQAATLLNSTFGTTVFTPYLTLGVVQLSAKP